MKVLGILREDAPPHYDVPPPSCRRPLCLRVVHVQHRKDFRHGYGGGAIIVRRKGIHSEGDLSACSRKGSDSTRSLGSAMQNVLREIPHHHAITLSRFIKPEKSKHERAIYHGATITPAKADTL